MGFQEIKINGSTYSFKIGQTIFEIAEENHIHIPSLCHLKGTTPDGKCQVCVIEIDKEKDLKTACTTIAAEGLSVWTHSFRVIQARKQTIKTLLSSGNHNCAIGSSARGNWTDFQMMSMQADGAEDLCPAWGDCLLQNLSYEYQVEGGGFKYPGIKYPMETINPLIIRDFSRCILCGRCVKACNEVQVNRAIHLDNDETGDKVIAGKNDVALKDSDCVFCGECVQACPVGALVEKKARYKWRPWEITKIRTTCPYCGVGCQLWLHVKNEKIIKVTGVENGAPNKGRLCVKGRFGYDFIYSGERLKTPLIKENNIFREATWNEALDLVAKKFMQIIEEDGPDALAGVSCARSINEDSYQMQKLFRAVFKTNNIDHCART